MTHVLNPFDELPHFGPQQPWRVVGLKLRDHKARDTAAARHSLIATDDSFLELELGTPLAPALARFGAREAFRG
jgi:hypothetical protein